jgi:hypothetical protein
MKSSLVKRSQALASGELVCISSPLQNIEPCHMTSRYDPCEERPSLLAFSRLLHDFVMSEYCLIFKN